MATTQATLTEIDPNFPPAEAAPQMQVRKRNGALEPVDVNKIVRAVQRCCHGLPHVDAIRVASKTIGGLFDGASTRELDAISIQTAAALIAEEPEYSRLAARLLLATIEKEVAGQNIYSFSQSIEVGHREGVVSKDAAEFVAANARKLNSAIDDRFSDRFEYFGLRTVYDRYLLRHPITRQVIETPQHFFMRVSAGLSVRVNEAVEFYKLLASHDYLPSSPTLFNSGTKHSQMSSCYLLDSPKDSLESIYDAYKQIAMLSKFSGGIGLAFHRVRSEGSLIRATNGLSNGIVPWLRTLDASVAAVNQGGKRKGACCVYLEPWHADVESCVVIRGKTGAKARGT
jgi:ribonucleoside-diphosphate reductase alpha chain